MTAMAVAPKIVCPHCDEAVKEDTHDLQWCQERAERWAREYAEQRAEDAYREERRGL